MHKKEKTDAQRASVFTKIGKEISMAVRDGGPDPNSNSKLRDLIAKAKQNNVPNDNIDRIIKKASGNDAVAYDDIFYEGYGPGGVAVIVEASTDNRNRTASDIRHYFDKFGGNLGATGCVSFMFADKGVIVIENDGLDEDKFMEDALDSGAVDFTSDSEVFEVFTDPSELEGVKSALSERGYAFLSAEVEKIPSTYVRLDEENAVKMQKLLDHLEENDDAINVWHNWDE